MGLLNGTPLLSLLNPQEPVSQQKSRLEASYQLQQFFRDVEDEETWVREREPLAASTNTGKDLKGVQTLQKKHQGLLVSPLASYAAAGLQKCTLSFNSGVAVSKLVK